MGPLSDQSVIGVCGAGAMGAITQVAAQAGHSVIVYDSFPKSLIKSRRGRVNNQHKMLDT